MKNLFTVGQVAKCCGVSRATILRLENRGLLVPAYIDNNTGYRYYDNHNITVILCIKKFLNMGMSYDDIFLYYQSGGTSSELLENLEAKLSLLKRIYEEMQLCISRKKHLSLNFVDLPEHVCFAQEFVGSSVKEQYDNMYALFSEAVRRGYKPSVSSSMFVIHKRTDFYESNFSPETEHKYVCCIPLEPSCAPKNAVIYPKCRAISCMYYGSYKNIGEAYKKLGKKIRETELKPIDYARSFGIVAPYTGREIDANNYVTMIAVPIE